MRASTKAAGIRKVQIPVRDSRISLSLTSMFASTKAVARQNTYRFQCELLESRERSLAYMQV